MYVCIMLYDVTVCSGSKRSSSTALALNTIARLSLSMTMSMSSGLHAKIEGATHNSDVTGYYSRRNSEPRASSVLDDQVIVDIGVHCGTRTGENESSNNVVSRSAVQCGTDPGRAQYTHGSAATARHAPTSGVTGDERVHEPEAGSEWLVETSRSDDNTWMKPQDSPINSSGVQIVIDSAATHVTYNNNNNTDHLGSDVMYDETDMQRDESTDALLNSESLREVGDCNLNAGRKLTSQASIDDGDDID